MPRSLSWYQTRVEEAADPSAQLAAAVKYLQAVLSDRDPGLANIALERAAVEVRDLADLVRSSPTVNRHDMIGMRYLPPHMEDPWRPGWLNANELRLRRRSWAKCKDRERMYAEACAAGTPCAICKHQFVRGEPPYMAIDHIVPLARGGTNARVNLQVLCDPCNMRKGAKL